MADEPLKDIIINERIQALSSKKAKKDIERRKRMQDANRR